MTREEELRRLIVLNEQLIHNELKGLETQAA